MARYFQLHDKRPAYNLERCEEFVLIDAYLCVKPRVPSDQQWIRGFEFYFFTSGKGVATEYVEQINSVLARIGKPQIEVAETAVYEYGRNPDTRFKTEERARIRDEISGMQLEVRERLVITAKAECQRLPPPRMTYKEYAAQQEERRRTNEASRIEVERRQRTDAVVRSFIEPARLKPQAIVTLLEATDDQELRNQLLGRLSVPEILAAIPAVQNQVTRNALVRMAIARA